MLNKDELRKLVEDLYNTYDTLNEFECIKTDEYFDEEETIKYVNEVSSKDLDVYYSFEENVVDKVMDKVGYQDYKVLIIYTDDNNSYLTINLTDDDGLIIISFDSLEDVVNLKYKLNEVEVV